LMLPTYTQKRARFLHTLATKRSFDGVRPRTNFATPFFQPVCTAKLTVLCTTQ